MWGITQGTVSGASNWKNYITNAYSFNNKGFEVSVNYDKKINENVKIGLYGNFTSLKNEITSVYGGSFWKLEQVYLGNNIVRLEAGQAVGSYYGYQVDGIFQNQAEVSGWATQNGATVGGFKFKDMNGDGVIDARDKTFLGSPIPKGDLWFWI